GSSTHAFRCIQCGSCWLGQNALTALLQQLQKRALADAYRSLPEEERKELARDLAASQAEVPSLSPAHALLAVLGFPVVSNIDRRRTPYLTWCLAGALVVIFVAQSLSDGGVAQTALTLAYRSDAPSAWAAVRAVFVHAGWLHLMAMSTF